MYKYKQDNNNNNNNNNKTTISTIIKKFSVKFTAYSVAEHISKYLTQPGLFTLVAYEAILNKLFCVGFNLIGLRVGFKWHGVESTWTAQGYVRRRIEAKLINWPFSPLRLAS